MSIQDSPKLTYEELYQTGMDNFNSVVITTIGFLKKHQISIHEYVTYVGERFAKNWPPNLTACDLANEMAKHFMSVGANIEELVGDEDESHFVMTGWLPADVLLRYSGNEAETDLFIRVSQPIAEHQNCSFEMERQDDRVICKFRRKS